MLLLLCLFTEIAYATPDMLDIDHFLSADAFISAYQQNNRAQFTSKSCVGKTCSQAPYEHFIEAVDADSATMATRTLEGEVFSRSTTTRQSWEQNSFNRVRIKINMMTSYGFKVTILSINSSSKNILVNDQPKTIETRIVVFEGVNAVNMKTYVTMEVAPNLGATAQVLSQSEDKGVGVDSFEVTNVFR